MIQIKPNGKALPRKPARQNPDLGGLLLLFALLPLIAVYIDARLSGGTPSFQALLGAGEMLLITAAISADTMGRILTNMWHRRTFTGIHLCQLLFSIVLVVASAMEYMSILARKGTSRPLDIEFVVLQSQIFFHATWLTGVGSILVLED
jgi:hypothetical protein